MGMEYIKRTEHGEDAVFTPFPIGLYPNGVDPHTWERGTWEGAGKWWLDVVRHKKCGMILQGHPNSGVGAYAGYLTISEVIKDHQCLA